MNLRPLSSLGLAAVLFTSLACSLSIQSSQAGMSVAATADEVTPLVAGDKAPQFSLQTVEQQSFDFDPQKLERPVVLLTFRGGWCPYCNVYLSEMRHVIPEIKALGVDVLFLSGDRPELLFKSLSMETQEDIAGLDYTILSDANAEAAIALGIAFTAGDRTVGWLQKNDYDIEGSSIAKHHALPVPAVFAIDTSGVIRFSHINPNYKVRLPADELIAAVRKIATAE